MALHVNSGHLDEASMIESDSDSAVEMRIAERFRSVAALERAMRDGDRVYGGQGNPTIERLELRLAQLEVEGCDLPQPRARITASGTLAMLTAVATCRTDDRPHVVLVRPCYEGTEALLRSEILDLDVTTVDLDCGDGHARAVALLADLITARTAAVIVEATTNPTIAVIDLEAIAHHAHRAGARVIADATLATPFVVQPMAHGADIVVHSLTKALSGHGDVSGGVVIALGEAVDLGRFDRIARQMGGSVGPHEAFLMLRGLDTAAIRIERSSSVAARLAVWLTQQPGLTVHYPGLTANDAGARVRRHMRGMFGPLVSIEFDGGREQLERFVSALRTVPLVPSFGDIHTTVAFPHAGHPADCGRPGCSPRLLRISVGIDDADDLVAEFAEALSAS